MSRNQAEAAQELYDERGSTYDDSWHPRFARHMIELIKPQPGENVLDLACGTGLVSFPASTAVGSSGSVTGVDISSGMLREAEAKKSNHQLDNLDFYQHSVTDLNTLQAIQGKQFDVITCCSALVLLEHPGQALQQWTTYLKPNGRLLVDVTHPQNQTSGVVFEQVGLILGRPVPWHRLRFQTPDDLRIMLEGAGFASVNIRFVSQLPIDGTERLEDYIRPSFSDPKISGEFDIKDADGVFDKLIEHTAMKSLASPPEVREQARKMYQQEWAKLANEQGKVLEVDGVFVGIGHKP